MFRKIRKITAIIYIPVAAVLIYEAWRGEIAMSPPWLHSIIATIFLGNSAFHWIRFAISDLVLDDFVELEKAIAARDGCED